MKKYLILLLCLSAILSCKKEKEGDLLKGEFVYYGDAAVLQTDDEIYGVLITDKTLELSEIAKKHQKQPTDMVQVEILGKITNQKDEKILWEKKVEVIEILNVTEAKQEEGIIKLGE